MRYSGDIIIAVMGEDGSSQVYSSIVEINAMQNSWTAGVPTISMQKFLLDGSGKMEQIRLNIQMPGIEPQKVRNLQVFANFQYLLTEKLNIDMAGMMHIDLDTPNGVAKARVNGNLNFD